MTDDTVLPIPAPDAVEGWRHHSGRRCPPPEVWERVQTDYLAGLSGPACARRHGVGLSTLRDRAARGGWRRADQPWIPPEPLDPDDEGLALEEEVGGDLDQINLHQLVFVAGQRMLRAVLRGDARAALRWRRVRDALDQDETALQAWLDEDERLSAQMQARRPDSSDGSD